MSEDIFLETLNLYYHFKEFENFLQLLISTSSTQSLEMYRDFQKTADNNISRRIYDQARLKISLLFVLPLPFFKPEP